MNLREITTPDLLKGALTELKTEYILTYHRKITSHHTAFITLEYEHIKNFG